MSPLVSRYEGDFQLTDDIDSAWDDDEDVEGSVPADDPEAEEERKRAEYGERIADNYLLNAEQVLRIARLVPDWLFIGALPKGTVNLIAGKPETNKSWIGYQAILSTVRREPWLVFPIAKVVSPTAFVLNYDNPPTEMARRFKRMGLQPSDRIFFHSIGAHMPPPPLPATLQFPEGFPALMALVAAKRPDIIMIDSHRQSHFLDDNSNQDMAILMSQYRQLATATNATVIAIHHTRKDDDVLRGAGEIEAALDSCILVADKAITFVKTRGWNPEETAVAFKLVDEGDTTRLETGLTLRQVLASGPKSRLDIGKQLGIQSSENVKKLVQRAINAGWAVDVDGPGRLVQLINRE